MNVFPLPKFGPQTPTFATLVEALNWHESHTVVVALRGAVRPPIDATGNDGNDAYLASVFAQLVMARDMTGRLAILLTKIGDQRRHLEGLRPFLVADDFIAHRAIKLHEQLHAVLQKWAGELFPGELDGGAA